MIRAVTGLRCVDGSDLAVVPVASLDRGGNPFEITLELWRDGDSFGAVGERCGYFLADLAARVAAARADGSPQAARWSDPDDRFPEPCPGGCEASAAGSEAPGNVAPGNDACGGGAYRGDGYHGVRAREPELFAFRYRDRGDVVSTGELRCTLRTSSLWVGPQRSAAGRWRVARRAVLEAWGTSGRGVRAVLTSAELARFLAGVLAEAERAGDARGGRPGRPAR
ncbi:hypothetical protein ACN3XK_12970 [Actinomadura welshii]